jgi:hypothetical protein
MHHPDIIDISLAAPLLIIGFVIAFLLVRYMEKREASQTEKK